MTLIPTLLAAAAFALSFNASAQESTIRKNLAERIPQFAKIDEVRKTPMPGSTKCACGTDLFYTDAKGNYLIQGNLIDIKARRNLTEDRVEKLSAVDFEHAAAQGRLQDRARQRQAQAGGVRGPELRLLQALRARPAEGRQRHRPHSSSTRC